MANLESPFLKRIALLPEKTRDGYPFSLPIFKKRPFELAFDRPITFFVGDNGTGKSTLLEAIAKHCGFNLGGGSRDNAYATDAADMPLAEALRFSWLPKVTNGFFLRAESYFNFASYIEGLRAEGHPAIFQTWGDTGLHDQSHGPSLITLFRRRLGSERRAVYLLDEPEAALSPKRQLEFLALLHDWAESGNVQAIVVTHSPILMGFPDATLLSFDGGRIREVAYRDIDHYRLTLDFLADPEDGFARAVADAKEAAAQQERNQPKKKPKKKR
jgi:predicted ATPase